MVDRFKSGFTSFSQIRWAWIGFEHFTKVDVDLELNFLKGQDSNLDVNIDRFGLHIRICGIGF